jgi:hypothetical protein
MSRIEEIHMKQNSDGKEPGHPVECQWQWVTCTKQMILFSVGRVSIPSQILLGEEIDNAQNSLQKFAEQNSECE